MRSFIDVIIANLIILLNNNQYNAIFIKYSISLTLLYILNDCIRKFNLINYLLQDLSQYNLRKKGWQEMLAVSYLQL